MAFEKYYKNIELPHLRTSVYFLDMSLMQSNMQMGSAYTTKIEDTNENFLVIGIFIKDIEKNVKEKDFIPAVAHEIMHAIQIIVETFVMDITEEREHTAYIMSYLLEQVIS